MADVTDVAFRKLIAEFGKPDVMWTEFVSADGLLRAPEEGRRKLMKALEYSEGERPVVAQFFSANPIAMENAARLAAALGFDGVDINMGCPDRSVERQGSGAAHIKNSSIAREIIRAAKRGAPNLPISVKTRIGYNKNELSTWLPELLSEDPAVVTIHARTRKEMSNVPARWQHVREAVEIRDNLKSRALIFGNGDVKDVPHAFELAKEYGADGAMLGRAIFGNPWLFKNLKDRERGIAYTPNPDERITALARHTEYFNEFLDGWKNFAIMKKHFKAYISGWDGAKNLRGELMETNSAKEALRILQIAKR